MKTIVTFLLLAVSTFILAEDAELYEIKTQLSVDKKPLKTKAFTLYSNESRSEIFEDDAGKPYKVLYQATPGEEKGTIEVQTQISTIVLNSSFLLPDNEEASFIIKPEMPELDIMVKARKLEDSSAVNE